MPAYNFKEIEQKWQEYWASKKTFQASEKSKKPKYYALVEFPYPSGDGLHVGHPRPYTGLDVVARKKRAEGFEVLYPFGWDAFGLPTENYAIKTGVHPSIVTKKNTDNFRRQTQSIGFSFDWSREVNTTDPAYYKWTQWIFLQLFKHGLAYKAKMPINWCPKDKIGLANEEVVNGCCERCGTAVEKREKEQWMLAITKYADRLIDDLDSVDYVEQIKTQQKNWIGRSEGAEAEFKLRRIKGQDDDKHSLTIFTTRPDTMFGATFVAISPELGKKWLEVGWQAAPAVRGYIEKACAERAKTREQEEEKTGIDTGVVAVNPVNGEEIPVWVANYVMGDVGTGAIMAVPAHDERDFEFAKKFGLKVVQVVQAPSGTPDEEVYTGAGALINSGEFTGKNSEEAKWLITEKVGGKRKTNYKLRDWVFSRQRYWGEPIPLVHCKNCAQQKVKKHFVLLHGFTGSKDANFFPWLKKELESRGHSVFCPDLPNTNKPIVRDQIKFVLENTTIDKDTVLIGHSLGCVVAMKMLEEQKLHVAGLVLAAPPLKADKDEWLDHKPRKELLDATDWEFDYEKIKKFTGAIRVLGDLKDDVVPLSHPQTIAKNLDAGYLQAIGNDSHFCAQEEPAILREVLAMTEQTGWVPLPEKMLPLELPNVEKYQPTDNGESPLAPLTDWVNTECPKCGGPATRETDTMPNWAGSSWYFMRYADPHNKKAFANPEALKHWLPVDWYNGGMEHTTLHLLYSRFWHKFLWDIGAIPFEVGSEPYKKRTSHGLILAKGGVKMSKSKGNVVNPDEIVGEFGADVFRTYEMFMGPFDQAAEWDIQGLTGVRRFLERVWKLGERVGDHQLERKWLKHKTINEVSARIEAMSFNTAVSALMVYANALGNGLSEKDGKISREAIETLILLLSPFAPHMCEEMWEQLGHKGSIAVAPWPQSVPDLARDAEMTIVIQVNGKLRDQLTVAPDTAEEEIKLQALASEKIQKWLEGKTPKKIVYVKGKLISIVV